MQPMKIFPALASVLVAVLGTSVLTATAQTYPSKPIRMMVPAAPGGVTDIAARAIAPQMTELLGQPIIVDNRSGAGGVPGTDIVAKASADGYTMLAIKASQGWAFGQGSLTAYARLDNLTDKRYVGSVIVNQAASQFYEPAPGRNWTLGLRMLLPL